MQKRRAVLAQLEAIAWNLLTAAFVLPIVIIPAALAALAALVALLARLVRSVRARPPTPRGGAIGQGGVDSDPSLAESVRR